MRIGNGLLVVLSILFLCGCGGNDHGGGNGSATGVNNFSVSGTTLLYQNSPVFLKGIGYSPFHPGETPDNGPVYGNYSLPDDGRYASDLTTIKNLNANFIVVFPQFMPPGFFSALRTSGLLYEQCIAVNGFANDLLDSGFQQSTAKYITTVIDHTYAHGVPAQLAFFSVGDEINAGTIFRTDSAHPTVTSFQGRFIHLTGRTPSEIAIAMLMDGAMAYETDHYKIRHLYTHTSWTHIGPVANRPDLEVSQQSVFFANFGDLICMNIYTYARGVVTSPPGSVTGTTYQGYVEDLERIATKPTIITQVGLSTSPVAPNPQIPGFGGNSLDTVTTTYRQVWNDVRTSNQASRMAGLTWFEYMDEDWKGSQPYDPSQHDPNQPEEWFGMYQSNSDGSLSGKGAIPGTVQQLFGAP